jgi:anti-anti-sigma regulatory factor
MEAVSMQQMTVTVLPSATNREVRVVVAGELDIATSGRLNAELDAVLARRPAHIQVDLSSVTFFPVPPRGRYGAYVSDPARR